MAERVGNKKRAEPFSGKMKLKKPALIALAGAALLTGLLFLAAVICVRCDASGWMLPVAAYLCCAASAFPVGFFTARSVGKSGLLCGLLSALPQCILLLCLCLTLYGSVGSGFPVAAALLLFCGALGGIAALNLRHKRRFR